MPYVIRLVIDGPPVYVAPNRHFEVDQAVALRFPFVTCALHHAIVELDLDPSEIVIDPVPDPAPRIVPEPARLTMPEPRARV